MMRTIADHCDGDVSAADAERPKFGRVSLHAAGCRSLAANLAGDTNERDKRNRER
jgi:hypothetical protein